MGLWNYLDVRTKYRYKLLLCIMDITSRKYHLIERVMKFNEEDLSKVEIFLKDDSELSASLGRAINQVEEGKVTPHEEVRKRYERWL